VPTNQPNLRQQPDSSRSSQPDTSNKESFQVSAPSISLPNGGGAIRGIGEKFGVTPVTGTGSMTVPIATSSGSGRLGLGPNSEREEIGKSFLCQCRERIRCKSQSRNPCTAKGRRGGHEWAAIGPLPLPVSDSCLRRIFRWRVPPNWSISDWRNEMRAEAACAACQAARDYDPSLGVPFGAFARQRVLTGTLTRCRQEWAYALRLAPEYDPESSDSRQLDSAASAAFDACPGHALARLSKSDLWLVGQLFLRDRTEADIATEVGMTQQAISKRKRAIVMQLRRHIDPT